jgi:hypothetical protein
MNKNFTHWTATAQSVLYLFPGNLEGDDTNGLDTNYLYTGQQFDPSLSWFRLWLRWC